MKTGYNQEFFSSHFVLFNVACNRVDNPVDGTGLVNCFIVEVIECSEKVETRDHVENPRECMIRHNSVCTKFCIILKYFN
jgi:hypothetical protein